MSYTHTGDATEDHVLDENSDEGHLMIKGLARWTDNQVDYDHIRAVIAGLPHLAGELPRS